MTSVITHRGLDPSKFNFFLESSIEAFTDQLQRGFGVEFDIQLTKDEKFVVVHDSNLERISEGKDSRMISEILLEEIEATVFKGCHIVSLDTLLTLRESAQNSATISALHLKRGVQEEKALNILATVLERHDTENLVVFDAIPSTAIYLKKKLPDVQLAASVSDTYDIERFGPKTGNTLLSFDTVVSLTELFDWVVVDEWDRNSRIPGVSKVFYTEELFSSLHEAGFSIMVISPELHGSSPGLLGGESHQDGLSEKALCARLKDIVSLCPDAICTDYPDLVLDIIQKSEET